MKSGLTQEQKSFAQYAHVRHLERWLKQRDAFFMLTITDIQQKASDLTTKLNAFIASEASTSLPPGQVAVAQGAIDAIGTTLDAASSAIDNANKPPA